MAITAKQIITSIPFRFRSEKAQGLNTTFHFEISGDEQLQYTVAVSDGKCQLSEGLNGTPDCTVKTKSSLYVDLETGNANPQMALMMGRIKISNIAAMMQFAKCFRKFDANVDYSALSKPQTSSIDSTAFLSRPAKDGPLKGVKIIDFTRLLPGPLATMFLADMGADVIKVEDPDSPDYVRDFEPRVNGMSLFYLSLNRNKRSLAVNYLSAEGKQLIHNLVKDSDVFVEQFRPGVMREMGFGYDELSRINPKLIYVSITGYGQQSNMAMSAGHDLNYIAIAGALGITGNANGEVTIPGFQLADIAGGSYMAMNAVTAALYQRERTGKGEWIDVAMTDAALPLSALQFAYHQGTKQSIGRGEFELSGGLANYNVYVCSDGKYVALGSLEPKFWNKFCNKVNRPDWTERFLTKGEELQSLKNEVKALFLTKTRDEWVSYFSADDICLTVVNDLEEIENDKYLNERKMFLENEHVSVGKYKTINQPLKFLASSFANNWSAPDLGDDTATVLNELKLSDSEIAQLKDKGIVKLKQ
jgi:crotonobetainyl-CoA:carnitine CoA-transferase CaiB-like acyl-CoA transferase/putative sterol carrier protein